MSYRGRGGRGRDRRTDDVKQRLRDKLQQSQNESNSDDRDAESSNASNRSQTQNDDKPPPGLRGRDIGMWYARRNRERREAGEAPPERRKVEC